MTVGTSVKNKLPTEARHFMLVTHKEKKSYRILWEEETDLLQGHQAVPGLFYGVLTLIVIFEKNKNKNSNNKQKTKTKTKTKIQKQKTNKQKQKQK